MSAIQKEFLAHARRVHSEVLGVTRLEWDQCADPEHRRNAETETSHDLLKPLEQLVCDVHEEANAARGVDVNLLHAIKRMVSMMARVTKSNERLARWMFWLTMAIGVMTLIATLKICRVI